MPVITDDRLVAVLATYEVRVDRVLQQIRDEPDDELADAEPGPEDPPPGRPGGRFRGPLRVGAALGRGVMDRLVDPVVDIVRGQHYPGQAGWLELPAERRAQWWVGRISTWAAGPAALPWVAGKLSDRLPIKDALSAAGQGLVVCAVCREYGVEDPERRICLLAEVLAGRRIEPAAVGAALARRTDADEDDDPHDLPAEFDRDVEDSVPEHRKGVVRRAGRTLWSLARVVREVPDLLDERPKGHLAARALGMLPGVGVVGGYLAERTALGRAGDRTEELLASRFGIGTGKH